ncbi:BZ3500_MvSof-1268-A1-R1_Chr3-3g06551 [Microbotryum saponariae]|uniref:UDP-N-acetylglucosamine--dolichyl-phosphate N-acetylglucosaminephosphotransferase n=1 Tax=Microbotryum saponariae TaxID=289078 RepID=A0A2X0N0G4_9BASI|nr:BZ3500_MvSof-1268-A1-R1_Chr3-3g06551 [Microbotryum saponariae]SDA04518.1 BZ3501_MvSof-1269-A2-R1_Chr3-2g06238 [Microbotryum saponariae]
MSTGLAEPLLTVVVSLGISIVAYGLTARLVPMLGPELVKKGLAGKDMLKPGFKRNEDAPDSTQTTESKSTKKSKGVVVEVSSTSPGNVLLPEATGVIGASVYILLLSLFAPLPYLAHLLPNASLLSFSHRDSVQGSHIAQAQPVTTMDPSLVFPHHSFATYLASLLSLLMAVFLGFMDDVFDIRWRWKLPIPGRSPVLVKSDQYVLKRRMNYVVCCTVHAVIASVPLLVTYAAGHGVTDVVLPNVLGVRTLFDAVSTNGVVHLGPLYYLYMSMLSTFCTNSINILAGVNGVEVGQALVIALSIALNDLLHLTFDLSPILGQTASKVGMGLARGSAELSDRHMFSLYFMLPLIGVCFGLLKHNWYVADSILRTPSSQTDTTYCLRYPARAFIGDTFCYFSGMAFAVVGITGHFSKTLLLFFLPQIFNFLYSTPQLFGLVPCPRHRLPHYNPKTRKLEPSFAPLPIAHRTKLQTLFLETCHKFGLVQVKRDAKGQIEAVSNFTVLTLIMVWFGPMTEPNLTKCTMGLQVVGSLVAFGIRYGISGWFYDLESRR